MRKAALMSTTVFTASILLLGLAAAVQTVSFRSNAAVLNAEGLIKGAAALDFESHYNKQFPAKTFGTNLWGLIDYGLFREGRPGVVVGKSDWLYTDEEFKTYAAADATMAANLRYLRRVSQQMKRQNSLLLVVPVPAKRRLYPEFTGGRQPSLVHAELYASLGRELDAASIAHVDLLASLSACKSSSAVFLRTDTHWTPDGARCAAVAIGEAAQRAGYAPSAGRVQYQTTIGPLAEHRGDLLQFIPLAPYFSAYEPPSDLVQTQVTGLDREAVAATAADLFADAPAPEVVLVGTSYSADAAWNFAGALQQALGTEVLNRAEKGQGPFLPMQRYMAAARDTGTPAPRLVIWEIPERMLPVHYDLNPARGA